MIIIKKLTVIVCTINIILCSINDVFSIDNKVVNESKPPIWLICLIIFALGWMLFLHFKTHYKKVTPKKG